MSSSVDAESFELFDVPPAEGDTQNTDAPINTETETPAPPPVVPKADEPAPAPKSALPKLEDWGTDHPRHQDSKGNKERPDRFEYWQSKADQEKKARETETAAAAARIKELEERLAAGTPAPAEGDEVAPITPTAGQPAALEAPKKPERPERPADYNEVEAYNDTSSASFKYRRQLEDYRDAMLDFSVQRQDYEQRKAESVLEAQRKREGEARQVTQVRTMLQTKYGMSEVEATSFMEEMNSGKAVTLDNLVKLHRLSRGSSTEAQLKAQREAEILERNRRADSPLPPIAGGEASDRNDDLSEEDMFNIGLVTKR